MMETPQRTAIYDCKSTDSRRWGAFDLRAGDIIVSTPPKSGTTWMQALCAFLIHGTGLNWPLSELSPWLDMKMRDFREIKAIFETQTHRRIIKTHTPLDGVTYREDCLYLTCFRRPIDVHFSVRDHFANRADKMSRRFIPEDPRAGFEIFLHGLNGDRGGIGVATLESVCHHLQSVWRWRNLPNVHLFHYADLSADLPAETSRLADALGVPVDEAETAEIAAAASFDAMKQRSAMFAPEAGMGFFKDEAAFFRKGGTERWRGHLTEADLAAYAARLADLLPADQRLWLERGVRGSRGSVHNLAELQTQV